MNIVAGLVRQDLPAWLSIHVSWRVLVYTALVAAGSALLAGLVPALRAGRTDLADALKEGGRGVGEGVRHRLLRSALVVGEVALALVLLVGAGLMVRSFLAIARVDPGFDPSGLLTFRVELGWRAYPDLGASTRFQRELLGRLAQLPGVRSVATTDNLPLAGRPKQEMAITLEGQGPEAQRANPFVNQRTVSTGFFETLRLPLLAGRTFSAADLDASPHVVVLSSAAARTLWPGRDPIGRMLALTYGDNSVGGGAATLKWATVVGVVGDVRHDTPTGAPSLDVYVPTEQWQANGNYFVLRVDGDPHALARRAPELVAAVDPDQSTFDVRTMSERIEDRTWVPRLSSALFGAFGALAAVLAAIGVYAVLAFTIAQRRHELSIRQALGASPAAIARLVLGTGLRLAALGCLVGLGATLGLGRLISHLLFQIDATDAWTLAGVVVVLIGVCLAACWIPAWRATRIAPLESMRGR